MTMTRKQTMVATPAEPRTVEPAVAEVRARKRSAADQLMELAARTQDPAFRQVLLRQVAHLRQVASTRTLKPRRA
jgi:hypothetical protein